MLAAQADERWASKPSALDMPDKQQPIQPLQSRDPQSGVTQMNADQEVRDRIEPPQSLEEQEARPQAAEDAAPQEMPRDPPVPSSPSAAPSKRKSKKEPRDSPWDQAEPPKDWQPQGWTPAPARRRG